MNVKLPPGIVPYEKALWHSSPLTHDSDFLTVHYINRYCGPHRIEGKSVHSFWELLVMKNGYGQIQSTQESLPLKPTVMILIPPEYKHRELADWLDTIWIGFEGSVMNNVKPEPLTISDPTLVETVTRLWTLSQRRFGPIGTEIDGGVLSILGGFFRVRQECERQDRSDPVGIAIDWIHAHLTDPIAFPEVAKEAGVSEGHFYRLFKRQTGMTPTRYLNKIRIEYAQRMLRMAHLKISEVATNCGFTDPLYFSRVFKRHTGQCPETFRQTQNM